MYQFKSSIVGNGIFSQYKDILAKVRGDGKYHSVLKLVQPDDPDVRDIARALVEAPNFISAAQEFVHTFTSYAGEQGDYWAIPAEMLASRHGDCDDSSILLCSILRNFIPADQVYCAFGIWNEGGRPEGHMWVITGGTNGEDQIIESTASYRRPNKGSYVIYGIFNDINAFVTDIGIREFEMKVVPLGEAAKVG